MDFHKVVKYVMTVLFIVAIVYAAMNQDSTNSPVQQPINTTKFNLN